MAKTKTRTSSTKKTADAKASKRVSRAASPKATEGKSGKSAGKISSKRGQTKRDGVTVDRRSGGERRQGERRTKQEPVAVERRKLERRAKVSRRRQIDPTTCERDYTAEELEFMAALDEYKRTSGRMFPTCSEVLEVVKKLGYEKRPPMPPSAEDTFIPVAGAPPIDILGDASSTSDATAR